MVRASGGGHGKQAIHTQARDNGGLENNNSWWFTWSRADDMKLLNTLRAIGGHDLLLDSGLQEHKDMLVFLGARAATVTARGGMESNF
jgi:hypothetical protein